MGKYLWSLLILLNSVNLSIHAQAIKEKEKTDPIFLADPTIFPDGNVFYLYGTGAPSDSGFKAYRSNDLKSWSGPIGYNQGFALKKGDAYGSSGFWAPQVFRYQKKYFMAYTANEHIAIAQSNSPAGPFVQHSIRPLISDSKQIDPFVFIDDDGKIYLYYVVVGNGGNRIYVSSLYKNFDSVSNKSARLCIEATQSWETADSNYASWKVTEGPSVIKHKNLYYLIYSANHYLSPYYAVGYAVSSSPWGPWKKFENNPIIRKEITNQNGSGHGDLIKDRNGRMFYVFHTHFSADKAGPRKTAIIEVAFMEDKLTGIDRVTVVPSTFHYLHTTN